MALVDTEYEHVSLDEHGVPFISGATMKIAELVVEKMAYGWSPEEIHFQHPYVGFYSIECSWRKGEHPKQGSFNPDFFIMIGNDIVVIEIKAIRHMKGQQEMRIRKHLNMQENILTGLMNCKRNTNIISNFYLH